MFYLRNQTIVRIFAETKKQYAMMSREETYQLKYTIALIAEFAKKFHLGKKQAYNYLTRFNGLDYLKSYYDVLHTLSFEEAIRDISIICFRNGGKLQYPN